MSKQGSKYLRSFLYQAAMGAKLHSAAFAAVYAHRNMKIKDIYPKSRKTAKAKILSNIARRILEAIFICWKKDRLFNDKIFLIQFKLMILSEKLFQSSSKSSWQSHQFNKIMFNFPHSIIINQVL